VDAESQSRTALAWAKRLGALRHRTGSRLHFLFHFLHHFFSLFHGGLLDSHQTGCLFQAFFLTACVFDGSFFAVAGGIHACVCILLAAFCIEAVHLIDACFIGAWSCHHDG